MLERFSPRAIEFFVHTAQAIYFQNPLVGIGAVLVLVIAIVSCIYHLLANAVACRRGLVDVLDVQVIVRSGENGCRQREVIFRILNGTGTPVRVVEGVVTIFGLNETLVLSQDCKLCSVPEGIQPISTRLFPSGEGFQVPLDVIPKRVEVKVKNWR